MKMPKAKKGDRLDFIAAFDQYNKDNQKVWSHDRSLTVGASEAFGCLRNVWFTKRGKSFGFEEDFQEKENWGALRRGDLIENHHVVPVLLATMPKGTKLLWAGDDQNTLEKDNNSATPDGLMINLKKNALKNYGISDIQSDCVVLEIKSVDPRVLLDSEKIQHHGQTQIQMGLIRETTDYKPNYAVILYINASFLDDIKIFVVKFDPKIYEIAKIRANTVYKFDDPNQLAPEGKQDGNCKYCKWQDSCSSVIKKSMPNSIESSDEDIGDIDILIDSFKPIKLKYEKASEELDEVRDEIKKALAEKNIKKIAGSDWRVNYAWQEGRSTIDQKQMKEAGIDVDSYKKQGNGFEKLTITISKPKEG